MNPIKFIATVYSIKIDREGELKLTLTLPSSEMPEGLKSAILLEKLVLIQMEETL